MKLIQNDAVIDAIVAEVMELQDQENTTLPLLEKQMREVENGIENMLNAIQAGVLTNSTKSRLEKLEAQQKELEVRIAEEKIARPRLSENQVRFWLTRFRTLSMKLPPKMPQRAMVRIWVASLHQKCSAYENTLGFLFYKKLKFHFLGWIRTAASRRTKRGCCKMA
jgi:TolA-binding protein